jgi:hypothetical protein
MWVSLSLNGGFLVEDEVHQPAILDEMGRRLATVAFKTD